MQAALAAIGDRTAAPPHERVPPCPCPLLVHSAPSGSSHGFLRASRSSERQHSASDPQPDGRDPSAVRVTTDDPLPRLGGSDIRIAPPAGPGAPIGNESGAPNANQTSEFMAGATVVSVVFVESSGGSGNCSPADAQTEDWSAARRTAVLSDQSGPRVLDIPAESTQPAQLHRRELGSPSDILRADRPVHCR